MKRLNLKVVTLSLLTGLSLWTQAGQGDFTILSTSGTSISETPCVMSIMRTMTPGELESKKKSSCYSLVLLDATVKYEDGRVEKIDGLHIGHFVKKLSGSSFPESRECMEKYAQLFDKKFNPNSHGVSSDLLGAELILPENFTITQSGDGFASAINGHRDINLRSNNKYLGHLADFTNDIVNDGAKLIGSKDGFAIRKDNDYQCWSSASQRTVDLDEEKYDQELDGRVLSDSRKAASNIGRKAIDAVETGWNRIFARQQ